MTHHIEPEITENPRIRSLCQALLACQSEDLMVRFLRDLLTVPELAAIANRWAIAQRLLDGQGQVQTAKELSVSTRTVSNVARWLNKGPHATGGYEAVYQRISTLRTAHTKSEPQDQEESTQEVNGPQPGGK